MHSDKTYTRIIRINFSFPRRYILNELYCIKFKYLARMFMSFNKSTIDLNFSEDWKSTFSLETIY